MSKGEVRCGVCGTLNRVPGYSIRRIAKCGNKDCQAALLEPRYIRFLRPFYRWRQFILPGFIMLFIGGLVAAEEWDSWMMGLNCLAQKTPPHGLYARYIEATLPIPLLIASGSGANYFVWFSNTAGRPVAAFFIYGGRDLETNMPRGTFVIRHAAGDKWCGEQNLFGASTTIEEGTRLATFDSDDGYKLSLMKRLSGNFPTKRISRDKF